MLWKIMIFMTCLFLKLTNDENKKMDIQRRIPESGGTNTKEGKKQKLLNL